MPTRTKGLLEFRPTLPSEAEALSAIAIASKGSWGYPPTLLETWKPDLRIEPAFIRQNTVRSLWLEGERVGFFALKLGDPGELVHLWLLPEVIGRGWGARAFEEVTEIFRRSGVREFTVVADPHAEAFYLKMGATRIGEVESRPQGRMLPLLRCKVE